MFTLALLIPTVHAHFNVLVYGPTSTWEIDALGGTGYVTVWDETQWAAATTADFQSFQSIVIGEGGCDGPSSSDLQTLYDTRATWQPAIKGNIVVSHLSPYCHYSDITVVEQVIESMTDWTGIMSITGLYVSGDFGERDLDFLDYWGTFDTEPGGDDTVTQLDTTEPIWDFISATDLIGWGDVSSGTIQSYPTGWDLQATDSFGDPVVITFDTCDTDYDGHYSMSRCGGDDCDDGDRHVSPSGTEFCNGYDDNCDGVTDEASAADATTYFEDADGDGYGDPSVWQGSCSKPTGYVLNDSDCDDTSANAFPNNTEVCDYIDNDCDGVTDEPDAYDAATWYADNDGDGFGDSNVAQVACFQPFGYVSDDTDCDDSSSDNYPNATEVYYDGVDQDCDGSDACDYDLDGDLSQLCGGGDCNDSDATIYTGAYDQFYDGVDTDCDGLSDFDADLDGDDSELYGGTDCDDSDATIYAGAPELQDGKDNDCNGYAEDDDTDGDGITSETELLLGTDPNSGDTDSDGLSDGDETLNGLYHIDTDGDLVFDAFDTDDDDDGVDTFTEIQNYDWTSPTDTPPDTDQDGAIDAHDWDSDDDTIPDSDETEGDPDGDLLSNRVDSDSDGDGIGDETEGYLDSDGDQILDRLDSDDDNDGILTLTEGYNDRDQDGIPNYLDLDSDDDLIEDSIEGKEDSDGDSTPDYLDSDSDNDGLSDRVEGALDFDSDGDEDFRDNDDDDDSLSTDFELLDGIQVDSDEDGAPDHLDFDSDNDGFSDLHEGEVDSDGDGVDDRLDLDSDNDGVYDDEELDFDSDNDGIENRLDTDDDDDGIRTSYEGNIDTDNDGYPDYLDEDSDNDGVMDVEEGLRDEDCDYIENYVDFDDSDGPCIEPEWVELETGLNDTSDNESLETKSCGCSSTNNTPKGAAVIFLSIFGTLFWRRR